MMSIHALALHPADSTYEPPPDFTEQLRLLNFLGDEFDYFGDVRFRPGTSFFSFDVHTMLTRFDDSGILFSPLFRFIRCQFR